MMLDCGFRRQGVGPVIAELRLLRRKQLEQHFPAMIFDRSESVRDDGEGFGC
jgi:hypothetical protein